MPTHFIAFSKSIAQNSDLQVDAVADPILQVQNGLPTIPFACMLIAGHALSLNMVHARLQSPKITQIAPNGQYITPVQLSTLPLSNWRSTSWYTNPIRLNANEQITFQARQAAAAAQLVNGAIEIAQSIDPIPSGEVYTLRFTSTTAAVANLWTLVSYALDTQLPFGTYVMVRSRLTSANALFHRWTFDNQFLRPGFISQALETDDMSDSYFDLRKGAMGQFIQTSLPRLEVFCNAADASHTGYMDVIKVG